MSKSTNRGVSSEVLQLLREPHLRIPQDARTVPDLTQIPKAAPRITVVIVAGCWLLLFAAAGSVAWQAYQASKYRHQEQVSVAKEYEATNRVVAARAQSDEATQSQQFLYEQEAVLATTIDIVPVLRRVLEVKPPSLPLVLMHVKRPTPAKPDRWETRLRFRNEDSRSAIEIRALVLQSFEAAGMDPQVVERKAGEGAEYLPDAHMVDLVLNLQFTPKPTL